MSSIANNLLATFEKKMNKTETNVEFETHTSVPVEADVEVTPPTTPLQEMTVASLDAILNNLSDSGDFSHNLTIPKRAGSYRPTKNDRIQAIERIKASNAGNDQLTEKTVTYQTLSLADVCLNPDNYRSAMDYVDASLYESVKMSGKNGIKDIVLSSKQVACDDGVMRYPAIAGNRTLAQHFQLCENTGEYLETYELMFKVIDYDDNQGLADLQALRDLVKDNQGSLKPGKLDLARTAQKFMQTMTVKNAAKEVGLDPSELGRLNRILALPKEVLHHVDVQEKADHYAKALSQKQLEAFNISFYTEKVDGDTVVKVHGISLSSAQILSNHLFELSKAEDVAKTSTYLDFICGQDVIQAAQNLSSKDFGKWLKSQETMNLIGLSTYSPTVTDTVTVVEQALEQAAVEATEAVQAEAPTLAPLKSSKDIAGDKMRAAKKLFRKDCGIEYDDFINDMLDLKFKPIDDLDAEIANMSAKQQDDIEFITLCHLLNKFSLLIPA